VVAVAMTGALLAACGEDGPATGPVPVPPPDAQAGPEVDAVCAALLDALPDEVDPGVERRPVEPDSGRTAAWGDPPVLLECGVAPPERNEPPFVVNGVAFTTRDVGPATRWTTAGRTVLAAVTVPDDYSGAEIMLPLATAIEATLPEDPTAPPLLDPGPFEEPTS
jgi:hypothetical protein